MDEMGKKFLEEIKMDFCWYLYSIDFNKSTDDFINREINFPYCCLLSAQLISSFLYVHFSQEVSCVYDVIANGRGFGHAWSEIHNEIIDYTLIQFDDCGKELKGNDMVTRERFNQIIENIEIFHCKAEHKYAKYEGKSDLDDFRVQDLLAVEYAKKYSLTKDGFMKYLEEAVIIADKCVYQ